MGLKSAVMVVAGWEVTVEEDAEGNAEVEDSVVGWNEGGVASGSVVKRMPVDTVEKSSRSAFPQPTDDGDTTSCALLLGAEVHLSARGYPPFQTALHRVFFIYPLHPAGARC